MHYPTDRIACSMAFVIPVVDLWLEREIAEWIHHEESIQRPIATMSGYSTMDGVQ